jgi:hypothetical protein
VDELRGEIAMKMKTEVSQGQIDRLGRFVRDMILTLRCPNRECEQAFLDFDGCFAITCNK